MPDNSQGSLDRLLKRFITWLYYRFVLIPLAKEEGAPKVTQELYVVFDPDPEFDAQIEKNVTKPKVH